MRADQASALSHFNDTACDRSRSRCRCCFRAETLVQIRFMRQAIPRRSRTGRLGTGTVVSMCCTRSRVRGRRVSVLPTVSPRPATHAPRRRPCQAWSRRGHFRAAARHAGQPSRGRVRQPGPRRQGLSLLSRLILRAMCAIHRRWQWGRTVPTPRFPVPVGERHGGQLLRFENRSGLRGRQFPRSPDKGAVESSAQPFQRHGL